MTTTWRNPWGQVHFEWPLSGPVLQDISPLAKWFSPQIEVNLAGDREIEAEVISRVASYGKQLGILSDVVLALAEGKDSPEIKQLQEIVADVEEVKKSRGRALEDQAKEILGRLQEQNPDALKRVVKRYRG